MIPVILTIFFLIVILTTSKRAVFANGTLTVFDYLLSFLDLTTSVTPPATISAANYTIVL